MSDPRLTDPNEYRRPSLEPKRLEPNIPPVASNALWGWIVGAVLVVAALFLVVGYGMNSEPNTTSTAAPPASMTAPASTTGSGGAMPPANPTPRPAPPAEPAPAR